MVESWEHFYSPSKVYHGRDSLDFVVPKIKRFGDRVLLISLKEEVKDVDSLESLVKEIHNHTSGCIFYEQIFNHSVVEPKEIETIAHFVRKSYINLIVVYGARKSINIGKAVSILATNPIRSKDLLSGSKPIEEQGIPVVIFLSTSCLGEELNSSLILNSYETDTQYYLESEYLTPKLCVYDINLALEHNQEHAIKIVGGSISYIIENLLSKKAHYYSIFMCMEAFKLLNSYIDPFIEEPLNVSHLENIYLSSVLLGLGMQTSSLGLSWVISQVISFKMENIDFFYSLSIVLPRVMENYLTSSIDNLVYIARELGEDVKGISKLEAGIKTIELIKKKFSKLNLPQSFKDFNLGKYQIPGISQKALSFPHLSTIPTPLDIHHIESLLLSCL